MFQVIRVGRGAGTLCMAVIALLLLLVSAVPSGNVLQAGTAVQDPISLPVIMYHSLLKDPGLQGKYVISPNVFESDLQYIRENGYTPVHIQDLVDYVNEGKNLPEKPILLTFDDGFYNTYFYAYPLAKKYGMKIVVSVVGEYTDRDSAAERLSPSYSYLTWGTIKEMEESGYVEFQNHSNSMHFDGSGGKRKGVQRLPEESSETYRLVLTQDISAMQEKLETHLGKTPLCFTYPFGAISPEAPGILREMGFRCTMTCESRVNLITRDPECLYELGRFLRTPEESSREFFLKYAL